MGDDRLETFQQHRPLLFSIAYRMLGSVADAEDAVQEAFLRWRQAAGEEVRSPKAYLATITTRLCIDQLRAAKVAREEYVGPWLPEPVLTDQVEDPAGRAEMAESLSIAFLVLLESLSPTERAVFLLREVFGYEYDEIAGILGKSEANCRQLLRRARQHVAENRPRFDPSLEHREQLLQQFLRATANGNMEGLLAILAEDVTLQSDGGGRAAAALNPIYGPDRVARFLVGVLRKFRPGALTYRFAEINGQPGVVFYGDGRLHTALTCDVVDGHIQDVYIIRNPEKLSRLPAHPPS